MLGRMLGRMLESLGSRAQCYWIKSGPLLVNACKKGRRTDYYTASQTPSGLLAISVRTVFSTRAIITKANSHACTVYTVVLRISFTESPVAERICTCSIQAITSLMMCQRTVSAVYASCFLDPLSILTIVQYIHGINPMAILGVEVEEP